MTIEPMPSFGPLAGIRILDMTAALACAHALGVDTLVCAELLPEVEGMMVRGLNAQIRTDQDG